MALRPSTASFVTRQRKAGGGWHVLVTWPNGSSVQIPGFASDAEAADWIKTKSSDWLRARQTGSHD